MKIGLITENFNGHITLAITHGHKSFNNLFHSRPLHTNVLKVDVF